MALAPMAFVLVPSAEGLSTPSVYAELDRLRARGAVPPRPRLDPLVARHLAGAPVPVLAAGMENDLEAAALSLRPELGDTLAALGGAGALGARITGSGPTAFGVFADLEAARAAAERIPGAIVAATGLKGHRKTWVGARPGGGGRRSLRDRRPAKLPDPKKAIEDIATTLGQFTYAFVAGLAFLETAAFVGLLVPGETVVIVGGVIAGQGEIDLLPLIGIVWASCVLGDSVSFFIGHKLGRGFVLKHGARFKIDERRLEKVEAFFDRRGGMTILIGRFVGLVRALAPFVAGSSGFPYRRFLPFSVIGCGLWVSLFSVLGYVFYRSFDRVTAVAGQATLALGITVAVGGGVLWPTGGCETPSGARG